jgi:hypothetical protein
VKPGPKRRLAAVLAQAIERPDEGFLSQVRREVSVTSHAVHEPVDAIDVRVVQRPLGDGVAGKASSHQLAVGKS